jgi:hypothetical protein
MEQRELRQIFTIALAAMLAIFNGYAQQPPTAYLFKTLVSTGTNIGGHTFTPNTTVDGIALSDAGEAALVAHRSESGRERTAVFTPKRLVAIDGQTIDGRLVTHINATCLAINSVGHVGFEATYGDASQIGIFVEKKFELALSVSGSPNDFVLTDAGKVVLNAATAPPVTPTAGPGAHTGTTAPNNELQRALGLKVPGALAGILFSKNSPIRAANPDVLLQPKPQTPQRPQPTPQQAQAKSALTPPAHACAVPEFPYPAEWVVGAEMNGPIAAHIFDAPARAKVYESRFFGPMGAPFRVIKFSSDCKPLLIVIGDNFLKGRYEIWTPNGLFSRTLADGFLDLKRFAGKALPDQLIRADTPLRINRHGQVPCPSASSPTGMPSCWGLPPADCTRTQGRARVLSLRPARPEAIIMRKGNLLDKRILGLSDKDWLTLRDLVEGGVLITGRLGSGKSSTSGRALAYGLLRAGLGGLVLTVKSDETQRFIDYAKACGREADVIVFGAEGSLTFDPLAYSWNQPGRGAGRIETIIELFTTLLTIGRPQVSTSSESRYFELAVEELVRATLVMFSLGGERISISSIHKIITSIPTRPGQADEPEWQQSSECAKLVAKIRKRQQTFTESQWEDLDNAMQFALELWPDEDPRTRSNILSTWTGMGSKFAYDPLRRLFCSGEYSFTPEQTTHERKIIIIDIPILEFGRATSRICQILVKVIFQRAWLRHQYQDGCCNGAFLFQDEFSMLMHRHELHFHTVCRSSAIAAICLTPNINNIAAEEFGEGRPGSRTLGFLGALSVKIFHSQTDIETSRYAADLIGQDYRYLSSFSAGAGNHPHTGFGGTEHLAHLLEPIELSRLLTPDGENPYAEAVVYVGGKIFNATKTARNPEGRNYLRVLFRANRSKYATAPRNECNSAVGKHRDGSGR